MNVHVARANFPTESNMAPYTFKRTRKLRLTQASGRSHRAMMLSEIYIPAHHVAVLFAAK
jgi:hypothetical protein